MPPRKRRASTVADNANKKVQVNGVSNVNDSKTKTPSLPERKRTSKKSEPPEIKDKASTKGSKTRSSDGKSKNVKATDTTSTPKAGIQSSRSKQKTSTEVAEDTTKAKTESNLESDIAPQEPQFWLLKAEPESRIEKGRDVKFSIDDLAARKEPESWDGVRNYVARNNMRAMRKGDLAFFYHSNCAVPGIVGIMRIVEEHSVDESAFDPDHPYYDPKSVREKPKWDVVKVEFVKKFDDLITLKELRSLGESGGPLKDMKLLQQSRLSVSSVTPSEWEYILERAGRDKSS